jgi:lysozyme
MTISQTGIDLIKSFESCRLTAYWDETYWADGAKRWSIGWGTTINPDTSKRIAEGDTCTQEQADAWLENHLTGDETAVMEALKVAVNQNQFDALVSLEYNAHPTVKNTIYRLLNAGDFTGAALEFPKWDIANGAPSAGLLRRRYAEQRLFVSAVEA